MLTKRQHDLLTFINDELTRTGGVSPSFDQMREGLGLKSKAGITRMTRALIERGFIRILPHRARAIEVLRMPASAPTPPVEWTTFHYDDNGDGTVTARRERFAA